MTRFAAPPEDAFDIVVHTRRGRIAVNRYMTGIDDLFVELRARRGADYVVDRAPRGRSFGRGASTSAALATYAAGRPRAAPESRMRA